MGLCVDLLDYMKVQSRLGKNLEQISNANNEVAESPRPAITSSVVSDFDIAAAIHRQHRFADKMSHFGWLHSPHLQSTLRKALERYQHFIVLTAESPNMVPALDIDLVWHTHQLSPAAYAKYSKAITGGRLIDHDDTVGSNELDTGVSKTKSLYSNRFDSQYLICHSWYCEAIRDDPMVSLAQVKKAVEGARARLTGLGLAKSLGLAECGCHSSATRRSDGAVQLLPSCNANCGSDCSGHCSNDCSTSCCGTCNVGCASI